MTADNKHQPDVRWDQRDFEELKATWSPERVAEDQKILDQIFLYRKYSPLLAEALKWAELHGLQIFVDRTMVNARGGYMTGTGVLAIARTIAQDPLDAVSTMVHEIRHAWQEYNGFGQNDSDIFSEFYIGQAIREADAKAIGLHAHDQCRAAILKKGGMQIPPLLQKSLADEKADIGRKFIYWFGEHAEWYGDRGSKRYGQTYGLFPVDESKPEKGLPEIRAEFIPRRRKRPQKRLSIDNIQDIVQMGVNFSGTNNYLAALQPDQLPKYVLCPSLADNFWEAANDEQKKLTTDLRKAGINLKLDNKKPRHPWP